MSGSLLVVFQISACFAVTSRVSFGAAADHNRRVGFWTGLCLQRASFNW
ncbi:MAG: hypothetical protein U0841_08120 [Chloroflexia bacterium]